MHTTSKGVPCVVARDVRSVSREQPFVHGINEDAARINYIVDDVRAVFAVYSCSTCLLPDSCLIAT